MANHRAISGVVGAVILGLTLLIAVAALVLLTSHFQNIASKSLEVLQYRAQAAALAQSVTGWWLQQDNKLTINLTNNAAYTILVTTITIIYNDTSLKVLDKGDTVNITDCGPTGCTSYTSQLPTAIPATHTVNITVTVDKTVAQVSVTLSASPIVVAIPLKNYYQIYGNVTVVTAPPPPEWSVVFLDNLTWDPTQPYAYTAMGYTIDYTAYYPSTAQILEGTHLSGTLPDSVNQSDGTYYQVYSAATAEAAREYNPVVAEIRIGVNESTVDTVTALASNDNRYYLVIRGWPTVFAPAAYFTNETYTLGAETYYKLMIRIPGPSDTWNISLTSQYDDYTVYWVHEFLYPVADYEGYNIPAATWTVYYYAWWEDNTDATSWCIREVTAYLNISVIHADGTETQIASFFAEADIGNAPGSYFGSGTFPGYTVTANDAYLKIEVIFEITLLSGRPFLWWCLDAGQLWTSGTFDVYFVVNDPGSRIEAADTWAQTYTVEVVINGTSNLAYDWRRLVWGLDLRADRVNVSGYASLHDYGLGAYPTTPPGRIDIANLSTVDTVYSETIDEAQYPPESFRDPVTSEWSVLLRLDRNVTWNEGFKVYIDWVFFNVTYVSEYTADTVFIVSGVEPGNVYSVEVFFNATHNTTLSGFEVYLWNYATGSWDLVYSATGVSRVADTVTISVGAGDYVDTVNGEIRVRIRSVNASENAWPFVQATDELRVTVGYYGAPALVVGSAGVDSLYVYRYLSDTYSLVQLPLTPSVGLAVAASGYSVYVVYGGNTTNFTLVDLATGSWTALRDLPEPSVLSHLVVLNATHVLYMPRANDSRTYYLYDNSTGSWLGPYTAPVTPPIYACTVGAAGAVVCANATHLVAFDPSTAALLWSAELPLIATQGQAIIGLVYDDARGWYIVLYQTGDLRIYSSGKWYAVEPTPPASAGYSILLQQDPDRLYYLKYASRELYVIRKDLLQLTPIQ